MNKDQVKSEMSQENILKISIDSEVETLRLGAAIATAIQSDFSESAVVISLVGTLGAGKTRLVKGIAQAYGVDEAIVVSPTFSIVNHYVGKQASTTTSEKSRCIDHLDVYRIADDDEFLELGIEEMFEADSITIVEWGDRFDDLMPDDYLRIEMELGQTTDDPAAGASSQTGRVVQLTAIGNFHAGILPRIDSVMTANTQSGHST